MSDIDWISRVLIIAGTLLLVVALLVGINEITQAKKFCDENDADYSLSFFPLPPEHLCDGDLISKYSYGWDYDSLKYDDYFILD